MNSRIRPAVWSNDVSTPRARDRRPCKVKTFGRPELPAVYRERAQTYFGAGAAGVGCTGGVAPLAGTVPVAPASGAVIASFGSRGWLVSGIAAPVSRPFGVGLLQAASA